MDIPLILLLRIPVTLGRLIALMLLVPEVVLPAKAIFKPLVVIVPAEELLVKDNEAKLSLLVEVVKVSANLPDDKVRLPEVIFSLPEAMVKFLPVATVVSPPKVTAPVEVLNVPAEAEASKLPEV